MLAWFKAYQDQSKCAESDYQTLLVDGSSVNGNNKNIVSICPSTGLAENRQLNWLLSIVLGVAACAFVLSLLLYSRMRYFMVTDLVCSKRMSAYSPLQEAVAYEWVQHDSDVLPQAYIEKPTQQIEDAWENLEHYGYFGFPYEKLEALNKSLSQRQFLRAGPGHMDEALGSAEMYHQVHCVNYLRQYIYREQWNFTNFEANPVRARIHMDHCIMILKTNILCMSDVTPVLFKENPQEPGIWKPYSAPHKCRRWDLLGAWTDEHTLYVDDGTQHLDS